MKTKNKILSLLIAALFVMTLSQQGMSQPKKEEVIKIKTSAVCGECKDRIEQGLAYEKGIKDVTLDTETKIATVTFNPLKTNPDKIKEKISKLGYDADDILADPAAYAKLPACCKKDAKKH